MAADVRSGGPAESIVPEFYLPMMQAPGNGMAWDWVQRTLYVVARTNAAEPATLTTGIDQALRRVDASLPVFDIRTMEQRMAASVATSRFKTRLLTLLGAVVLLLAAVGIYGVIAYFVSQRTQEIGIRLALGAAPSDVRHMVIRQAMKPALAGLALGLAASLMASNLLASQLHGVGPRDPLTLLVVCLTFMIVALLASWAPARRAAAVEPTRALRQG